MHEIKKDCFAYRKKGGIEECIALRGLYCSCGECKFYKKKEELCKGCPNTKGTFDCKLCNQARKGM